MELTMYLTYNILIEEKRKGLSLWVCEFNEFW